MDKLEELKKMLYKYIGAERIAREIYLIYEEVYLDGWMDGYNEGYEDGKS